MSYAATFPVTFSIRPRERRSLRFVPGSKAPLVLPAPMTGIIDSDPRFCLEFESLAHSFDVPVRIYDKIQTLNDLKSWYFDLSTWNYDLFVISNDLSHVSGIEVARFVESTLGDIPILLIGNLLVDAESRSKWPPSIRSYSQKSVGADAVFNDALTTFATDNGRALAGRRRYGASYEH